MEKTRVETSIAAEILGLRPGTLEVWRSRGRGPRYAKIGRRVFYNIPDLENFANSHIVETVDTMATTGKNNHLK